MAHWFPGLSSEPPKRSWRLCDCRNCCGYPTTPNSIVGAAAAAVAAAAAAALPGAPHSSSLPFPTTPMNTLYQSKRIAFDSFAEPVGYLSI